jgi:hypothetical protein
LREYLFLILKLGIKPLGNISLKQLIFPPYFYTKSHILAGRNRFIMELTSRFIELLLYLLPLSCQSFLTTRHCLRSTKSNRYVYPVDIEAATVKLIWEDLLERTSRPVLDLSMTNESILIPKKQQQIDTSDWDQGQVWCDTQAGLNSLGIEYPNILLQHCPQLFRLATQQVLQTAEWVASNKELGIDVIMQEPRVLSYPFKDVEYGIEYLQIMTMFKIPFQMLLPLLIDGIIGGLQERAIQEALSDAAEATYSTNKRIAGETASVVKAILRKDPESI